MSAEKNRGSVRMSAFARNEHLEHLLKDINEVMWLSEQNILKKYDRPNFHLILIMGPLRSGTTLFLQWLSNTGVVSYPTNLLSRFYHAPILGAKIQLLLTDSQYNFRDELPEFSQHKEFNSENGKTRGSLAPNEFWYFWRRFLDDSVRDVWTDEELRRTMNVKQMLAELAGVMDVFKMPFAAKGMLFNYNIKLLSEIFDKVIFVQLRRDPIDNVSSILAARQRQTGNIRRWYSFNIPEYNVLKDLDAVMQSAGQYHFISKAVNKGMAALPASKKMVIDYEAFCASPEFYFDLLCKKLGMSGVAYEGPSRFHVSKHSANPLREEIRNAVEYFANYASFG